MLRGKGIIETGEILAAGAYGDARRPRGTLRQLVQMREPPVTRREQRPVAAPHQGSIGTSPRRPDGEDERQSGPPLPLLAKIHTIRIAAPGGEDQGRVS